MPQVVLTEHAAADLRRIYDFLVPAAHPEPPGEPAPTTCR